MPNADLSGHAGRRLAAIVCADVEGYARLMKADETGTMRLLTAHRDISDRLIGQHGGRIANTAGDSILAEFPSAVVALQCALSVQERIEAVNREIPEDRRIAFRIGLHVGEVVVKSGDLFGDGVNIAARMQSLARPGSVCVSETAHQFLGTGLPVAFEDLGPQYVKNIKGAIRAFIALPSTHPAAQSLPSVHRRVDAHLARRFHQLCHGPLIEITKTRGLIPVEFAALASIDDSPAMDADRLAMRLGAAQAEARRMLRLLHKKALVRPKSAGGKKPQQIFSITAKGRRLLQSLRPKIFAAQDRVMAALSEQERQVLQELLTRVIKANTAQNDARRS
jgi:class 3 adenylate cyclase/DNA-binding MarR family transcriptional regulator